MILRFTLTNRIRPMWYCVVSEPWSERTFAASFLTLLEPWASAIECPWISFLEEETGCSERETGGNHPSCFSHLKPQACEWGYMPLIKAIDYCGYMKYHKQETRPLPTQLSLVPIPQIYEQIKGCHLKALSCGGFAMKEQIVKQSVISPCSYLFI